LKNYIKYPIALNKETQELIEIKKVTDDNRKDLICKDCNDNFVAVLNHPTPHFKHKPNSSCKGNEESYIHWVTKEIFKQIKEIELPELFINDLPEKHREKFQITKNKIIDPNVPETFRSEFKKGLKEHLFESKKILIDKIDIEKEFKTTLGDIRVDIVANTQNKTIFIEPFFTSKIDKNKKEKLSIINIPTLSLNLIKFIESNNSNFSIRKLTNYLFSKNSKNWVYLNDEKYDLHIKNYENYLFKEIERMNPLINSHISKLDKISELELKCQNRIQKINLIIDDINDLKSEIVEFESEIDDLKEELGIYY